MGIAKFLSSVREAFLWQLIFFALALLAVSAPGFSASTDSPPSYIHFDLDREFPRYFLPESARSLPPDKIPEEVLKEAQVKLQDALSSVLRRMEVPLVIDGQVQTVRYLEYVNQEARKINPDVRILPSGGLVRAAISYLYEQLYEEAKRGQQDPYAALDRIAREIEGLPAYLIRGTGSDLDVLLLFSKGFHAKDFFAIKNLVVSVTASTETKFEMATAMRRWDKSFKRSIYTIPDVKDYHEQTDRSVKQGGAAIDFLCIDPEKREFILPAGHPEIVLDLLRGFYEYLDPTGEVEEPQKQTARGFRALVELPFLRVKSDTRLRQEIDKMEAAIDSGAFIDDKVFDQFDRLVRNARFSGAHNRIHRGAPGSLEERILRLSKKLEEKVRRSTIPEFLDSFDLASKPNISPEFEALLMPVSEFIAEQTEDGHLYHGTPQAENSLAVMRSNFFLSKINGLIPGRRTMAAYDRGAYFSKFPKTAEGYAGQNGVVFRVAVKADPRLRIFDLQKHADSPFVKALRMRAEQENRDPSEILAREYGVDFVLAGTHAIGQNSEALLPFRIAELIAAYGRIISNPHRSPISRFGALKNYRNLHRFAQALHLSNLEEPLDENTFVRTQILPWILNASLNSEEFKEGMIVLNNQLMGDLSLFNEALLNVRGGANIHSPWQKVFGAIRIPWHKAEIDKLAIMRDPEIPASTRWNFYLKNIGEYYQTAKEKFVVADVPGMRDFLLASLQSYVWNEEASFLPMIKALAVVDPEEATRLLLPLLERKPGDIHIHYSVPAELEEHWPETERALFLFSTAFYGKIAVFRKKLIASQSKNPDLWLLAHEGSTASFDDGVPSISIDQYVTEADVVKAAQSGNSKLARAAISYATKKRLQSKELVTLLSKRVDSWDSGIDEYLDGLRVWGSMEARETMRAALIDGEKDPSEHVRNRSYRLQVKMFPDSDRGSIVLLMLDDASSMNRDLAFEFIPSVMGTKDEKSKAAIIERIKALVKDPEPVIQDRAREFLGTYAPESEAFQDSLIEDWSGPLASRALRRYQNKIVSIKPALAEVIIKRVENEKDIYAFQIISEREEILANNNQLLDRVLTSLLSGTDQDLAALDESESNGGSAEGYLIRLLKNLPEKSIELQRRIVHFARLSRNPLAILETHSVRWAPEIVQEFEKIWKKNVTEIEVPQPGTQGDSEDRRMSDLRLSALGELLRFHKTRKPGWFELFTAKRAYKRMRLEVRHGLLAIHRESNDMKLVRELENLFAAGLKKSRSDFLSVQVFSQEAVPRFPDTVDKLAQIVIERDSGGGMGMAHLDLCAWTLERLSSTPDKLSAERMAQQKAKSVVQKSLETEEAPLGEKVKLQREVPREVRERADYWLPRLPKTAGREMDSLFENIESLWDNLGRGLSRKSSRPKSGLGPDEPDSFLDLPSDSAP